MSLATAAAAPSTSLHRALLDTPAHLLVSSTDLDETCAAVGRVMKPHRLGVLGASRRVQARMHHVALGGVGLSRLKYGAPVQISPGPLDDFFLVQMPLAGGAQIRCGGQAIDSTPRLASVLSPTPTTAMCWDADSDQLMVRVSRGLVERTLAAQLGREPDEPLQFTLGFAAGQSAPWACLVAYLVGLAGSGIDLSGLRLLTAQIEQLTASTLLAVQPHNHSHQRPARTGSVLPRHVRKVQEHLQAHADEPVDAEQLAQLAGVSLRSLYAGFRDFCGVSPMVYLKQVRLDRVRAELATPDGPANVAGVALRWGFGHLGRFSADYKARFGESPSQTLLKR